MCGCVFSSPVDSIQDPVTGSIDTGLGHSRGFLFRLQLTKISLHRPPLGPPPTAGFAGPRFESRHE